MPIEVPTSSWRSYVLSAILAVLGLWPTVDVGTYNGHHPTKDRAADFMIPGYQTKIGNALGWALAKWIWANRVTLGVWYVIFDGKIISRTRPDAGWQPYFDRYAVGANGKPDPSRRHTNHVHTSWYEGAPSKPVLGSWDGSSFPGAQYFYLGAHGAYVTFLGQRLVAHGWTGYLVGPGEEFHPNDQAGVQWFQKQQTYANGKPWTGADVDGIPGPETWRLLVADPAPTAPTPPPTTPPAWVWDGRSFPGPQRLTDGSDGPWVTWLGERLVAHGYTGYQVGPGPEWGPADTAGVLWFKRKQGWRGGPTVGQATWDLLAADPPPAPPKPTPTPDPEPPVTSATIRVVGANILRRTDKLLGRLRWLARRANVVKHLKQAQASVALLCEVDKESVAYIADKLGWNYYPSQYKTGSKFSPLAVLWDPAVWARQEDSFVREYSDNDNRFLQRQPLVHRATGKVIPFYVSHLENDGGGKGDHGHIRRHAEAKDWASWTLDGPGIFYADLNSTTPAKLPEKPTARQLQKPRPILAAAGWRMVLEQARVKNRSIAGHHSMPSSKPGSSSIDEMGFKGVTYVDAEVIDTSGTDASDHQFFRLTVTV